MDFKMDCERVFALLETYVAGAATSGKAVLRQPPLAVLLKNLDVDTIIAKGALRGEPLERFLTIYLAAAVKLHGAGFMAHQVAVPEPRAALGALVDAFTNNSASIYEMGPSAGALEFALLNWMLRKVGWKPEPVPGSDEPGESGGGVLTHGGSLANLTALMAARARAAPNAWREGLPRDFVIVAPEACHYSVGRTADIFGMGQGALMPAPVDENERIVPERLAEQLRTLSKKGHSVLAVVANACSTAAGLFDPLREIGRVCANAGVWFHVDGAHGASALVSNRLRSLLDGVESANSLSWDAHKMLRTPSNCTAVLVRDRQWLDRAFHQEASYLFHDKKEPGVDFIHRSFECTKAGLGLKLFLALAAHGEAGVGRFIESRVETAQSAARFIASRPLLELATDPQFNIVCFRVSGSDELQLAIRRALIEDGRFFISTTLFRGRRWLRLALMNGDTTLEDIQQLVTEVEQNAIRLIGDETDVT